MVGPGQQKNSNTSWPLLIIGLGIGILTGLSTSPVVSIVISSLLAAIGIVPILESIIEKFSDHIGKRISQSNKKAIYEAKSFINDIARKEELEELAKILNEKLKTFGQIANQAETQVIEQKGSQTQ